MFTAAQAAQKIKIRLAVFMFWFTAAQAAQKDDAKG